MGKGPQGASADPADVAEQNRVRQAAVHFPLAGDRDNGLGTVRVIDWGRGGLTARMTLAGPVAHTMGADQEIEATIRTVRLCGDCHQSTADGPLMVELVLNELHQISGASYTLALAIADKMAHGCLPRLEGRSVVATGQVLNDGGIDSVGRIAEKLEVVKQALARASLATPLLVLPRANLDRLTETEQHLLGDLIAAGTRCEGVAALADMDAAWPPELRAEPQRAVAAPPSLRRPWLALPVIAVLVVLSGATLHWMQEGSSHCGQLSADSDLVARCWGPLPLTLGAECRVEHLGGYRPWRPCESGTCLAGMDQFRLVLQSAADGWLYAFHLDATDQVLEDLWSAQAPRRVRSGETIRLPAAGRTYRIDGRSPNEHFFALLTRRPLPESTASGADSAVLAEVVDHWAERFTICREPVALGR